MAATTRERMILSAALLMRERGARATSIDDVLQHSGAPRGSVYHHFPGGRDELLREATRFAGEYVARRLEPREGDDPLAVFDAFVAEYRENLIASGMRDGCPVAAVAIEWRDDDAGVQQTAGEAFAGWEERLVALFAAAGVARRRARELAVLAIAALEGALLLSRAQRDLAPLDSVHRQLRSMLREELP